MESELEYLKEENSKLKKSLEEIEGTSKMLVKRDIDLRQAYEELKQLDRQKSEFVSTAAHQLRTPLTSVKFALQMLKDALYDDLSSTQQEIFKQGNTAVDRMFEMTENLLTVDALDYGTLDLQLEPQNLTELIHEIINSFTDQYNRKHITLSTAFDTSITALNCDRNRLQDVISNVLDNAIKYTPENGTITISTSTNQAHITISVSDTGIGFDTKEIPNLFKKFSRLDNAKRVDANGSGLGLYISKKIIEKHNGTITMTHNEPQGTIVTITLPI